MAETSAAAAVAAPAEAAPTSTQATAQQTGVTRRDYVPDAKRKGGPLQTPELAKARALYADEDIRGARAEARRISKDAAAPVEARWEADDLLDRTDIDAGPLAAGVAMLIAIALMLMYYAALSGVGLSE